jgi:deoxycytidine triphosphate deaminase
MTSRSKSKTTEPVTTPEVASAQLPAVVPPAAPAGPLVTDIELEQLVKDFAVIAPFAPELLSGCSYDLRIGKPIRSRNRSRVFDLSKGDFSIESGETVTFETMEILDFSRVPLFGFIVNKHSVLAKGLAHPITKVDPGFHGPLAITLFNHGNKAETIQYGQPLVSLVMMVPSGKVERIYGVSQRPSYREGSLDIAAIDNEPERPLDDKGLSKMYGRPLSRLYERVEELEKRFDVGLIKANQEGWRKGWDLALRWLIPALAIAAGAIVNQNWAAITKAWSVLFP